MFLLILFSVLFLIILTRCGFTASHFLFIIYILSLLGVNLLYPNFFFLYDKLSLSDNIFLALTLLLLILPWSKVKYNRDVIFKFSLLDKKIYNLLIYANVICILINIPIFIFVFNVVTDYSSFKNGGGSVDLLSSLPSSSILFLLDTFISASAILLIPYHFYYLSKRNYKATILSILLSLNFPLFGLLTFSRSNSVIYIIVLLFNYLRFKRSISSQLIRKYNFIMLSLLLGFSAIFYSISANRFGGSNVEYVTSLKHVNQKIENPTIYSFIDYFSQWYINASDVIPKFNGECMNGKLSFSLFYIVSEKISFIKGYFDQRDNQLRKIWPNNWYTFNGISANLLIDLNYWGTLIFLLVYFLIVFKINNKKKIKYSFDTTLYNSVLFILPATGIFSSEMNGAYYNFLLIICLIIYVKKKYKLL